MTTKQFVKILTEAVETGYKFSLAESMNLGPKKERLPRWVLRCDEIPHERFQWSIMPLEAVHYYVGYGLFDGVGAETVAREKLGLSRLQVGMILRAGEQIVGYNFVTGKLRVKYSNRLRQDMLKACRIEEKCKARTLFK